MDRSRTCAGYGSSWGPVTGPTATARSRTQPNELNELEQLPLDLCSDAELSPEEEPDHKQCGEGDLAHLRLDGECTAEEEVEGRPSQGSALASFLVCVGAVEVEADRPVLTVVAAPPPVLQRIASFKMSSAFLWLSRGGVCARSRP